MRIFKFCGISGQRLKFVKRTLEYGEIYFCPPADLNDPFEYSCINSFDATLETKLQFWSANNELKNALEKMSSEEQASRVSEIEKELNSIPEILFKNRSQGVYCASGNWQNQVLWSHYAENHKGLVIEFETDGIEILSRPATVQYSNKVSVIPFYEVVDHSTLKTICAQKYTDWSYEQEIRFFCGPGIQTIPLSSIKSVTFGLNCRRSSYPEFRELFNLCKSTLSDVDLYEVRLTRTAYQLDRRSLNDHNFAV